MNNRFAKGRALSLLLVLAMLVVSFATLLPITASADGDIQAFGVQALNDLDLLEDNDTDLRFVFKITNLDYEEVGIVISKTVATPTCGTDGCFTKAVTTAYSAINVSGTPEEAGDGLWWVAIKMTDVPHSYFDGTFYVRAFVKNADQDPIYSAANQTTVCATANHTHVQPYDAAGTATLLNSGNLTGVCPGCGLSIDFTGVTRTPVVFSSKSPNTRGAEGALLAPQAKDKAAIVENRSFQLSKSVAAIRGEDHFYPATTEVGAQGNDLWFEYSFLVGESFWNYTAYSSEMKVFSFRKELGANPANDNYKDFYYLYANNKDSRDCPYKGHFDYSTYLEGCSPDENCADDLTSLGQSLNGRAIGRYVAGWSKSRSSSPYVYDSEWQNSYGWHRLGLRFHQEVASVAGSTVTYSGYSELYIDGLLVWRVHSNVNSLKSKGLLLWTATASAGAITGYEDNDTMLVQMYAGNVMDSANAVTIGVGDVFWTCGNGFVQSVTRVDNPNTGNEQTNFFYTID